LEGRATARVEEFKRIDIFSDWPAFVEKHLAPSQVKEVGSDSQTGSEMDSSAREKLPKAGLTFDGAAQ
jgi:hypothetical protein